MSSSLINDVPGESPKITFPEKIEVSFKEALSEQSFLRIVFGETVEALCIATALSKFLSKKNVPHVVEPSDYTFFFSLLKEKKNHKLILIQAVELTPVLKRFPNNYDYVLLIDVYNTNLDDFISKDKIFQIALNGLTDYYSLSELTYFFLKQVDKDNLDEDILKSLIIGFSGSWKKNDFTKKDERELLSDCTSIELFQGLKLPGRHVLPIHLSLALMVDPVILGITGDEGAALDLLLTSKVPTLEGNRQRTASELSFEESRSLFSNLIVEFTQNFKEKNPPEIIGPIIEFIDEEDASLKDALEYHFLLFSLINSKAYNIALPICFGDREKLVEAKKILSEYRKMLLERYPEIIKAIDEGPESHYVYDLRHLVSWHLSKAVMKILQAKEFVSVPKPAIFLFKGQGDTVIIGIHIPSGVKELFPWDVFWEKISSPHILDVEVNSHNIFLEINSAYLNDYFETLINVIEPYFEKSIT